MENEESGISAGNAGSGAEGTVEAEPARSEVQGSVPDGVEAAAAELARKAELERIPPELRPDANGNPPVITEQLLRKLRARYFTVKHARLEACGHRFDLINEPRTNCEICWINFFAYHPQLVETADQFFRTQGKGPLIAMRGKRFVSLFTRYMSSLYHEQQEQKAKEAQEKATNADSVQPSILSGESGENPSTKDRVLSRA